MANNKKKTNTPVAETPVKEGVTDTPVVVEKEIPAIENPTGEGTIIDKTAGEMLSADQLLELAGNKPTIEELNEDQPDPSDYDITDYVDDSGRTAAPAKSIETALQLITNDPNVVVTKSRIANLLIDIMEVANKADIHKRAVFYGDLKVQSRLSKQQGVIESLRHRVAQGDLDFTDTPTIELLHAIWGIQSELGEIAEELILSKAEKRDINVANLKEENGDIMWYQAIMMRLFKTFFQNVAEANINKLKARYPDKFDADKALNRDLEAEKDALNS